MKKLLVLKFVRLIGSSQTPCLRQRKILLIGLATLALALAAQAQPVITPQPGYTIVWDGNDGVFLGSTGGASASVPDNDALASKGGQAFGSGQLFPDGGAHDIDNVIDGFYGNGRSWISGTNMVPPNVDLSAGPFIGVRFTNAVAIKSIAWGRDNTVQLITDRCQGIYTLQVTSVANPDASTTETGDPATGWVTIGTVQNPGPSSGFRPCVRHRYDVAKGGNPIQATGLRIKVPNSGTDIDEIEVNPIPYSPLVIKSSADYTLQWDGNDGDFLGASVPDNDALASKGGRAFGSGQLFPDGGAHDIDNVIDGFYGNGHSWISGFEMVEPNVDLSAGPFIGVGFTKSIGIKSIAWGRENTVATGADRWQGIYTLQVTSVANPDAGTGETGDPATGWVTIGTVEYKGQSTAFRPWLRHRYDVAKGTNVIQATGLRIKVSNAGIDIDEIEVNPIPFSPLIIKSSADYTLQWDGNDGDFLGASVPDNVALASKGGQAFGSGQLFPDGGAHDIDNVIDGFYGNGRSWISGTNMVPPNVDLSAGPFIGVRLTNTIAISSIAWGRENTVATGADRWQGIYTLQVTSVRNPDASTSETGDPATGWVTIGTVEYRGQSTAFRPWLRHRYDVAKGGNPIQATGLRIKVSNDGIDIDEIEINPSLPKLFVTRQANGIVISWPSAAKLQAADEVTGPWLNVTDATNPMTFSTTTGGRKFFRARQ